MNVNSKHKKGTISLHYAIAFFVGDNYIVSKPVDDHNEYDLIVDNTNLKRVQVKTIYWDN